GGVGVGGLRGNALVKGNGAGQRARGIRMTRLGHRVYKEKIVEQADPRGRSHYWLGGGEARWDDLEGTDMGAVHDGYVSLTPLHLDLTNHRALVQLGDWQGGLNAQFPSGPRPSPPAGAASPPERGRRRGEWSGRATRTRRPARGWSRSSSCSAGSPTSGSWARCGGFHAISSSRGRCAIAPTAIIRCRSARSRRSRSPTSSAS